MPNVDGPRRIANQAVVAGSPWTIGRPPIRKLSTSASFPGFASRRTSNATLTIIYLLICSEFGNQIKWFSCVDQRTCWYLLTGFEIQNDLLFAHASFNRYPQSVMRRRMSHNVNVIITRLRDFTAPALTIVRLLPKLNLPIAVEVG